MKKTCFLFLLLIFTLRVISQDTKTTILTFTANSPGDIYHPFTSVNVTNVTRGWTETLVYPDTVLVLMNVTTTVDELELCDNTLDVFPNPYSGQTNATFQMDAAGWAYVKVYDINGTVVASHEGWFEKGAHRLSITLEKPQMAILSVTTPNGNLVAKLIQTEHCGYNKIEVCNVENRSGISKEAKEIGDFIQGDVMSYEAVFEYDGDRISSESLTQSQYGDETITLHFPLPIGAINGLFSISETQNVWFSRGNLQYQASSNSWRFADHQYEYMGLDNANTSSSYSGWIDLFGWGTSGYNHGAVCYQPWSTNYNDEDYLAYGQWEYCLNDQDGQADWGYNAISNGNNTTHTWRTLSDEEWRYLLFTRATVSDIRYAKAKVNDVNGVILLPDSWSSSYFELNNANQHSANFSCNVISALQWNTLEQHGAVFLPAAGYRDGLLMNLNYSGSYWSSSVTSNFKVWRVYFLDNDLGVTEDAGYNRCKGRSVRLVYSYMAYDSTITIQPPTVTTTDVINVTQTTATGGGIVSNDGGAAVTERGICWSTNQGPTIQDSHASIGSGTGTFTINMTELTGNTTYYVKAYAINDVGIAYGNELSFTFYIWPDGVLPGVFSVSSSKQVRFSQGNLQYKASTNTWRFAENQFDYIGEANCNISPNYDGYIDLFGWGTSGWNCGNTYYYPWDSDHSDAALYGPPGQHNLSGDYVNSDWGYYNAISNGGNQINQWYTLLSSEWEYVFNVRQASTINGAPNSRFVKATVNGVAGVILFPDVYSHPDGVPNPECINHSSAAFSVNNYQGANWLSMEYAGAVFLPAAGTRSETHVWETGSRGQYWSTACRGGGGAVILFFKSNNIYTLDSGDSRYNGDAVRLVQIVQ